VGERKSLTQYLGRSVLLVFFNPACGFCRELAPRLRENVESRKQQAGTSNGGSTEPVPLIISSGDAEANRQLFAEHRLSCPVLLQKESEVATPYQANGTPSGYLISPDGKIASELAMGAEALLGLYDEESKADHGLLTSAATNNHGHAREERFGNRSLANSKLKRDGLKAGTPAPDFRLPRLDGRGELGLQDLRGKSVLLVFSSPGCGPCNALAPQLEKFHRAHPELEVVMVSKGEPQENRAKVKEYGLTFPIVLQQQWEISRRYAMFATPVAYMIDEKGVIAHDVAVATEAILSLMAGVDRNSRCKPSVVVQSQVEVPA
jgi:peroxiredoxin